MVSARPLVWRAGGGHVTSQEPGSGGRWSWLRAGRGVPVTGQGPGWRDPTPKERVSSSTEALRGQGHQGPSGGTRGREGAVGREHWVLSSRQGLPCGWDSQPGLWPSPAGGLCGLRPVTFSLWSSVPSSILWAFSPRLPHSSVWGHPGIRKGDRGSVGLKLIFQKPPPSKGGLCKAEVGQGICILMVR